MSLEFPRRIFQEKLVHKQDEETEICKELQVCILLYKFNLIREIYTT